MKNTKLQWLFSQLARASHTKAFGWIGEQIIMEMIPKDRFIVHKPRCYHAGDVHIVDKRSGEFVRLEVKTARANCRNKFQFTLRKHDKHGVTDIGDSDLVLLFCIADNGLFWFYLIPSRDLTGKTITVPGRCNANSRFNKYQLSSMKRLELAEWGSTVS